MSTTAIMTETLPTIVGMGVVSKTTNTMFGKNKRKKSTKKDKPKVYKGKRGSRYIKKNGRKIYI